MDRPVEWRFCGNKMLIQATHKTSRNPHAIFCSGKSFQTCFWSMNSISLYLSPSFLSLLHWNYPTKSPLDGSPGCFLQMEKMLKMVSYPCKAEFLHLPPNILLFQSSLAQLITSPSSVTKDSKADTSLLHTYTCTRTFCLTHSCFSSVQSIHQMTREVIQKNQFDHVTALLACLM